LIEVGRENWFIFLSWVDYGDSANKFRVMLENKQDNQEIKWFISVIFNIANMKSANTISEMRFVFFKVKKTKIRLNETGLRLV